MAIPRVAKQAIGAITRLRHEDGRVMIVNVEYNQLDPLLRAAVNPDGDTADPATGFSPYPGAHGDLEGRQ
jgi:UDP-sugar pyrophosphorylase